MEIFGKRALTHARFLSGEIGPRPAGSPAEARARDYAAEVLTRAGYAVERQPVNFAPAPRLNGLPLSGGLVLGAAAWALGRWPLAAMLAPLWIIALPQVGRWLLPRRACPGRSENLLAFKPGERPDLWLCAHLDSAPASAITWRPLLRLHSQSMFLGLRLALALAALGLLRGLGLSMPASLLNALRALGGAAGLVWLALEAYAQLARGQRYSPGAHDNASGAGVLLALAESQPGGCGFLFTGAEETGLHGARAFANEYASRQAQLINLDMVGAGTELRLVTRDGTLFPRATDAGLNAGLRAAEPGLRDLWYTLRSGDFLPALQAGLPAASLQTSGSDPAELAYHTLYDTPDLLDEAALELTARTLWNFLRSSPPIGRG